MTSLLGMILVTGWFGAVIGGLALARPRLHPELSRKLAHMGMGLATLFFPLLFGAAWPVWALSVSFMMVLAALRWVGPLRERFGKVLGDVKRQSWGEFYFPLAVAIVFTIAHLQPARYVISLLVLTLADAVAALIGTRFGKLRYRTDEGWKSIEGSLSLFAVAAISTAVPAAFMTHQDLVRLEITAICVGVLAALVEAIAWRGLDNLFLPLATLVVLIEFEKHTIAELITRLAVALGMLAVLLLWRQRTTLRDNALAGATLVLYLCFAVGGWLWLEPPLLLTMVYTFLPFRPQRVSAEVHGNTVILSMAAAGFVWLFLDKSLHDTDYRLPYVLSFALQLSMVFLARWKRGKPTTATWLIISGASFAAWLFAFVPALVVAWSHLSVSVALTALMVVAAATTLFCALEGHPADMPNSVRRWLIQTAVALAGSTAGLLTVFKR
jgi:phytol kinase